MGYKLVVQKIAVIITLVLAVSFFDYLICKSFLLHPWDLLVIVSVSVYFALLLITVVLIPSDINIINKKSEIAKKAFQLEHVWLNASFIWIGIYYLFTWLPLLVTCIVIYISGAGIGNSIQVMTYSILSLSLGFLNLFLRPNTIAKGYRKAYCEIAEILHLYTVGMATEKELVEAISTAENYISTHTYE